MSLLSCRDWIASLCINTIWFASIAHDNRIIDLRRNARRDFDHSIICKDMNHHIPGVIAARSPSTRWSFIRRRSPVIKRDLLA